MSDAATLVIDIGGRNVKLGLMPEARRAKFPSGRSFTPQALVTAVATATEGWEFARVTVGCPGPVKDGRIVVAPVNLGPGWVGFDFAAAFGRPTLLVNDAAMQAVGAYEGGKLLFLGLGTGLGAALVTESCVLGLELAHLPYRKGRTFEDYVGQRGLDRRGPAKWQASVADVVERLKAAVVADSVVLGGGNAKLLDPLPAGVRRGANADALTGGERLWLGGMRVY